MKSNKFIVSIHIYAKPFFSPFFLFSSSNFHFRSKRDEKNVFQGISNILLNDAICTNEGVQESNGCWHNISVEKREMFAVIGNVYLFGNSGEFPLIDDS